MSTTLLAISDYKAADTYGPGTEFTFTLTFDANTSIAGGTTLLLSNGATATYFNGSGGTTINFKYTVGATGSGQTTSDLTVTGIPAGGITRTSDGTALSNPPTSGSPWALNTVQAIDTTAPGAPTIADSAITQSGGVNYVNIFHDTASQTLSGTAEAGSTVDVYLGGSSTPSYSATADGSGDWSVKIGALANGTYSYTATATDTAGNVSAASTPLNFKVDTFAPGAPTITDSAVVGGYVNAAGDGDSQTLSGTAEADSTINIYEGSSGTPVYTTTATGGNWSDPVGHLADGNYSYRVTATDAAGNVSPSNALSFTVATSLPSAPTIHDTAAVGGYVNAAHDSISQALSGTALAGSTVDIYLDGSPTPTYATTADGGGNWSVKVGDLADGTYSYSATQTDAAGNVSARSGQLAFTVDTVAPGAPTITDNGAVGGYVNAAHDTSAQKLSGTAEAGSTVKIYAGGSGTPADITTADGSGNWSWQIGQLPDGSYAYNVTATDVAGNVGPSNSLSFTVDATPPTEASPAFGTTIDDNKLAPNNGNIVFGAAHANAITVADANPAGEPLTVQITGETGDTFTLAPGYTGVAVTGNGTSNVLTVTGSASAINSALDGLTYHNPTQTNGPAATISVTTTDAVGNLSAPNYIQVDITCFYAGTMIRTPEGEVAVETLKHGDLVLTHDGRTVPVAWLARQKVSTLFADPLRVLPIRVKAGALGDNIPLRDLLVSPDHALLVAGVLVHAGALVNDTSIIREADVPEVFTYYHVEVEDHSLIFADGAAAETFVDNVERMRFDNWDEYEALYPDGKTVEELPYPRAKARRQVPVALRVALATRAEAIIGAVAEPGAAVA